MKRVIMLIGCVLLMFGMVLFGGTLCDECDSDAECSDGRWCSGEEICIDPLLTNSICASGKDPCTGELVGCDEVNDRCTALCDASGQCSEGMFCCIGTTGTGASTCCNPDEGCKNDADGNGYCVTIPPGTGE